MESPDSQFSNESTPPKETIIDRKQRADKNYNVSNDTITGDAFATHHTATPAGLALMQNLLQKNIADPTIVQQQQQRGVRQPSHNE